MERVRGMTKDYETVRRMMLATNKIDGVYYLFAKRLGINENTLAFLYALDDGEPHSQKEICDDWLIPRTTINSIVKKMLSDGCIAFAPEQYGREKALVLTEKGKTYTDKLLTSIYTAEKRAIIDTVKQYSDTFVEALEFFVSRFHEEFCSVVQ